VGASPTRQPLQPEATGAVMEVTALRAWLTKAAGERAREPDPEDDRQASNLVFQGHPLANQLVARDDRRAER
jgi:hypothetical protein